MNIHQMKLIKLATACILSLFTINFQLIPSAISADQIVPDYSETFVPEIKGVKVWLAGGEKSLTLHLKLEVKVKKNSIWRVLAQVNTIPKTERVTCQIPERLEERGPGGTPETGHAQPIPNEKRIALDAEYSLVTYEFEKTSRVSGNGFPFCLEDYFLAYLGVYSTSGNSDAYSLPYDGASKRLLPLINLASSWANWYPDKLVPPCQEPVKSENYGVAWRTACQIKFSWPNLVLIESSKSSDDLAAEEAARAFKEMNDKFESEKLRVVTKLQGFIANKQTPPSYRTIFDGWLGQINTYKANDQGAYRTYLDLLRTWELKADQLMLRIETSSITCVKGKVTKVIKGVGVKCPTGYKKK